MSSSCISNLRVHDSAVSFYVDKKAVVILPLKDIRSLGYTRSGINSVLLENNGKMQTNFHLCFNGILKVEVEIEVLYKQYKTFIENVLNNFKIVNVKDVLKNQINGDVYSIRITSSGNTLEELGI